MNDFIPNNRNIVAKIINFFCHKLNNGFFVLFFFWYDLKHTLTVKIYRDIYIWRQLFANFEHDLHIRNYGKKKLIN